MRIRIQNTGKSKKYGRVCNKNGRELVANVEKRQDMDKSYVIWGIEEKRTGRQGQGLWIRKQVGPEDDRIKRKEKYGDEDLRTITFFVYE